MDEICPAASNTDNLSYNDLTTLCGEYWVGNEASPAQVCTDCPAPPPPDEGGNKISLYKILYLVCYVSITKWYEGEMKYSPVYIYIKNHSIYSQI